LPRYHEIVLAVSGECTLCGGCCAGCDRLVRKGRKWLCRDHPDHKPSHCMLFPIGYARELMPVTCSLVPTQTLRIDETLQAGRMRVSGRAGPSLFSPVDNASDSESDPPENSLYTLQARLETEHEEELYERTPGQHLAQARRLLEGLAGLESVDGAQPDEPLSWEGTRRSEELLREMLTALSLYATRRDLILGDLFTE
jgi:hypothetical protein